MQIFKFDALIQGTNKQDINYKANINILYQKINVKKDLNIIRAHWMKVSERNSNAFEKS